MSDSELSAVARLMRELAEARVGMDAALGREADANQRCAGAWRDLEHFKKKSADLDIHLAQLRDMLRKTEQERDEARAALEDAAQAERQTISEWLYEHSEGYYSAGDRCLVRDVAEAIGRGEHLARAKAAIGGE